jgi:hypothetical protein
LIFPADICVVLQLQLFGQLLPQQGGDSSILNAALWFRKSALQSTTCPALEVAYCCVFLLGFLLWEFISLLCPFFEISCVLPPPLHCLCFITVCCLFFRFSGFGCCCLPQEMISMIHYLPVLWGVAYGPPALSLHCLSCVSLLIVQC